MYRAITIIELLTTLVVIIISLYFFSPILFRLTAPLLLNNEIDHIRTFIYQVQRKSYYYQKDYLLYISQDILQKKWCMLAVEKTAKTLSNCNCLTINHCRLSGDYLFYQPISSQVMLFSKDLYPNTFLNFSKNLGHSDYACLRLSVNDQIKVLQVNTKGIVNEAQSIKRSKCR